uniref:MORN repeat-containing protein 3 n=1 Tax=Oryzias latipes TaxID=8090 RepID=A0A3P9L5I8_ORYLA
MSSIKPSKTEPPSSALKESMTLKSGFRHTVFSLNGDKYTGEWQDNRKHGIGIQMWKNTGAVYNGEWRFGKYDGYGTYYVLDPESKGYVWKYDGEWKNGKKHGYGIYFYNNTAVYEGEWSEGQRSGRGKMFHENRDIYEGEWMCDKEHGEGKLLYANGSWYEGSWKDGKRNGSGKCYNSEKGLLYVGFWIDGEAKCGTLCEYEKDKAPEPSKCKFPKLHLVDSEQVLKEAQSVLIYTSKD